MAAAPAAHLEHFDAAVDGIRDGRRRLDRPAQELARVPFLAAAKMCHAQLGVGCSEGIGYLADQLRMQLLDARKLADIVPAVAAGHRKLDHARGHRRIKAPRRGLVESG
jgi:hypothetical protein